jgi:hypothetical protein
VIQSAPIRRAIVWSVLAHAVIGLAGWWALDPKQRTETEVVDIEMAPPPPKAEALPPEEVRKQEEAKAAGDEGAKEPEPKEKGDYAVDAGIDAPVDAPVDARPDVRPDAAIDASPIDAAIDAPVVEDAVVPQLADAGEVVSDAGEGSTVVAMTDAGAGAGSAGDDAAKVASVEPPAPAGGSGSAGANAGSGSGAAAGSGAAPAVEGAPTSAGTAANLLTYFPKGHTTTALVRFDRLRGTEWAAPTERLFRPMPDYRILFGESDAKVADKLDTIIISTPEPSNAIATTLVARTRLARPALRGFLGAVRPVTWSAAKGGLLGKRGGKLAQLDRRVFLSPFKGWFLLGQPADLPGLLAPAAGDVDAVESTAKLPAWLASIRAIEAESGEHAGPALVLTLALDGKRQNLGENDYGLGVKTFPMPTRVSLAAEVVKQGWLVRGNASFANDAAAAEFVTAAEAARQRIIDSRLLQAAVGAPAAHVIKNLSFARAGPRVSYATSISIADMRAIMAVAAQQLDTYFASLRAPP